MKANAITLEIGIHKNFDGQLSVGCEEVLEELDELFN
jgi:hypothetical protein